MLQRLSPRAELILINVLCFGPFLGMSIASLIRREHHIVVTNATLFTMVGIEVVCGTLAVLILRARGWKMSDFTPRPSYLQIVAGMLVLIVANLITAGVYAGGSALTGVDLSKVTTFEVHVTAFAVVLTVLVNPIYEEFFEVAYNLKAMEGSGAAFAITLSATIRFACHLYQGPITAVTILPLGLVFAAVYWRWRTIWPIVVAHAVADGVGLWPAA